MAEKYYLKDAYNDWMALHPKETITLQTIRNWAVRFGWVVNADRVVKKGKVEIDRKKFEQFNKEPQKWLSAN